MMFITIAYVIRSLDYESRIDKFSNANARAVPKRTVIVIIHNYYILFKYIFNV